MPPSGAEPLLVLVVSHTHWDREWYRPAGRFRQRLVELIDALLDEPDADAAPFLLDGQAVVLEDYLAVRPERRDALSVRLRDGRIEAGPWYVLADELIPSGESLVRNLLRGRATVRSLGGEAPPVLYSPDAFGHPAMLPALARGFGLQLVVLWRGYGGPHWPSGDTVRWRAPDGSIVLVHHLAPAGYELGSSLPVSEDEARARWSRLRDVLEPRAVLGVALLPNGADHHAPQPALGRALAMLARVAVPTEVRRTSMSEVWVELARRAAGAMLPTIEGELRDSYGYTWTLQGTFATRASLKREHARVERLLVREMEPWSALAERRGARSRLALARAAWRELLLCQPHDTLCGCCADEVARAMRVRLEDAAAQGSGVRDDAVLDLIGHDPIAAMARRDEWRSAVIVRNAAPRPRAGVAEIEVALFRQHVAVGPGSGAPSDPPPPSLDFSLDGGRVPFQLLAGERRHDRVESPVAYPDDDLVDVARALAWVPEVSGYGTRTLLVGPGVANAAVPEEVRVRGGPRWIENESLRVEVDAHGHLALRDRTTSLTIEGLISFEDVGDGGDTYTFSPVGEPERTSVLEGVELAHPGPLRAELRAGTSLDVPRRSDRGSGRALERVRVPVELSLSLDAGSPLLRVRVRGENRARDHRLRLVFATGIARGATNADAPFGPVRRVPIVAPPASAEMAPASAPLHRYVTLADDARGISVFSDGLAEYETTPDGEIAITLVRAVGELSRNDLPERPGHAGWPTPTPEAQCLGPFEAEFALLVHGPRDARTIDRIERGADDALLPLVGTTLRSALRAPPDVAGLTLEGEGLAFSACKTSEDGAWLVLRCVNLLDAPVRGRWTLCVAVREARLSRLDETPLGPLAPRGHAIEFEAPPRAVVTLLAR